MHTGGSWYPWLVRTLENRGMKDGQASECCFNVREILKPKHQSLVPTTIVAVSSSQSSSFKCLQDEESGGPKVRRGAPRSRGIPGLSRRGLSGAKTLA